MTANINVALPKLQDGANFSNWKFRVELILGERGLESALQEDNTDKSIDAKAKSVIVQCLSDKYIDIVKRCASAADMLKRLAEIFERKSVFNKMHLRKQLLSMKCGNDEKIQDHFLKFEKLISELEGTGTKLEECDKVCHLLLTLPDIYDTVITTLETIDKELNIEFVKTKLLDAEIKLKGQSSSQGDTQSFIACFKCGKRGHMAYNCRSQSQYRGRRPERGNYYRGRSRGQGSRQPRQASNMTQEEDYPDNDPNMVFTAFSASDVDVSESIQLVVDSGATEHLLKDQYLPFMSDVETLDKEVKIYVANGQYLSSFKKGKLELKHKNGSFVVEGLIVSGLSHNLLSVRKLLSRGLQVKFYNDSVSISNSSKTITGNIKGKLYVIDAQINYEKCCSTSESTWHQRLGHANRNQLKLMNLPYSKTPCEPCMKGKSTRLPFPSTNKPRSRFQGELIHTDIAGPMRTPTIDEELYYHTIIDDHTHFSEVYLLKNKNEATDRLMEYINRTERQTGNKVKRIRSDNGGEFKNERLHKFCKNKGIIQEYTTSYSPQSNGVAERMNRSIFNKARTLLTETELPMSLWGEAVRCAVYQINRCPSAAIKFNTPAEKKFGNKDLSKLKVFGSKAWVHTLPKQDKLLPRAKEMRFVGYSANGYRLWDPESNKIKVSRDVRFDETQIKYKEEEKYNEDESYDYYEEKLYQKGDKKNVEDNQNKKVKEVNKIKQFKDTLSDESSNENEEEKIRENREGITTRSGRVLHTPKVLNDDYELYTAYCLLSGDPQEYEEAIEDRDWKNAIRKELDSQIKLETWEETTLPKGCKAIDTKWIFKTKQDGTKKARLVAKGFQQISNDNNYAPVAKISTIRLMMSIAVQQDMPLKQFDVPTAFLNGTVNTDVYIKCPKGMTIGEGKVLKLKKALYGLKEAPKCWYQRFHDFITANKYVQSKHDSCLYRKDKTWILLYVDDILYLGQDTNITKELEKEFKVKNLGEVNNYLGLEIERQDKTFQIKQTEMIKRLLEKFNMQDCKGSKTPMEANFYVNTESEIIDVPFKELIGALLYISTNTRPDITYAVSYLSRFLDKPTKELWIAGKRILRYLKETLHQGLLYTKSGEHTKLVAFSDADWAGDKTDRKSTSGCAIYHGNNLISWFSRKQTCTALSTAEAEYVASANTVSELVHIKGLLSDFLCYGKVSAHLLIDNQSTIKLINNQINTKASKHIAIKYHYIKDLVHNQVISISYVPTNENVSDIFTKALNNVKHEYFCNKLNIV